MPDVQPQEKLYQCLTDIGDGTGVNNAVGNYSSDMFEIFIANAERAIQISTIMVGIRDVGNFRQDRYGAMSALTNGIRVKIKDDLGATLLDMTSGIPIRTNGGWQLLAFDASPLPQGGGDGFYAVRWGLSRDTGSDIILEPGHRLSAELNDDFTELVGHTFFIYGTFKEGG